jgi:predicted PurR-regulated permease PerM
MRMRVLQTLVLVLIVITVGPMGGLAQEVPYTLEDRERLIRVETKLEEMIKRFEQRFEQVDKRFEQVDKRFEQVEVRFGQIITLFLGIIGAFAGVVAVTVSFAVWDRRTALAPALRYGRSIEERQERVERALRDLAVEDSKMADVLRRVGLM